jgi:hypothetical protein
MRAAMEGQGGALRYWLFARRSAQGSGAIRPEAIQATLRRLGLADSTIRNWKSEALKFGWLEDWNGLLRIVSLEHSDHPSTASTEKDPQAIPERLLLGRNY